MDLSNLDPNVLVLAGIAAPLWYASWSQLNRRMARVETYLTAKFGDREGHFKPGNGSR